MFIDLTAGGQFERGLINALVAPRPIAWVSTHDGSNRGNLAPFSHFGVASSAPPILTLAINTPADRSSKDTLANIRTTKEFTVNLVGWDQREQMVASSAAYDTDVDEAEALGIAMQPCQVIRGHCVTDSPARIECRLYQIIDIPPESEADSPSALVLGRVVGIDLRPDCLDAKGRFDPRVARLTARAQGIEYLRIEQTTSIAAPFRRQGES